MCLLAMQKDGLDEIATSVFAMLIYIIWRERDRERERETRSGFKGGD